jgi:8-oxo-dGTP diphosphatase
MAASSPEPNAPSDSRPRVDVAVGILQRPSDGQLLLAQRPAGKPYAGWWEFPGGKLERGESVEQALARELHEELGIVIGQSSAYDAVEYDYPHAQVRLHFRLITDWQGEPLSREGQALIWQLPGAITVSPLLPASIPVIDRLAGQCRGLDDSSEP